MACRGLFLAFAFIGCSWSAAAFAAEQTVHIPMYSAKGYFRESCFKLRAGQELIYQISTALPIDFNFHYHPGTGPTVVPDHGRVESHYAHNFTVKSGGVYCFMVRNPKERTHSFDVVIHFKVASD